MWPSQCRRVEKYRRWAPAGKTEKKTATAGFSRHPLWSPAWMVNKKKQMEKQMHAMANGWKMQKLAQELELEKQVKIEEAKIATVEKEQEKF